MAKKSKKVSPVPTEKYQYILFFVAFILIAALHFSSVNNEINGLEGDNAYYILLAKSIASFEGYRDFIPGNPPHVNYPPVFPLMLSPAVFLFGINFFAFHIIVVLAELASLIFLYFLFRRLAGQPIAFLCCVVFALNYFVNLSLVRILSEFPSLMIVAAALLLSEKTEECNKAGLQFFLLPIMVPVAYLTRIAGLSFLIAFLLYRLYRKQYRILLWNIPILFVPYLAWKLRARIYGRSDSYFSEFWLKNYLDPGFGNVSILEFLERIQSNTQRVAQGVCDFIFPISQDHSIFIIIIVSSLIIAGFSRRWIQKNAGLSEKSIDCIV